MQSRFYSLATLLLCLAMAACGGTGSFSPPPPPGNGPFSNASLSGNYAFTMTGNDPGFFMRAGSLVADGKGSFTGIEDVNSGQGLFTAIAFNGTYTVGGDGRGSLTANPNTNRTTTYRLTVVSNTKALIIQNDSFATASGNLTAQNTAAFNAGLGGDYAFDLSGVSGVNSLSIVGAFTANTGLFQNFETDMNEGGSPTQNVVTSGNFSSVDPTNGRGTSSLQTTLGILNFAYYIVSANQSFFMSTSPGATAVSGAIFTQQPPVGGFVSGAFLGDYSFLISGSAPSSGVAQTGAVY